MFSWKRVVFVALFALAISASGCEFLGDVAKLQAAEFYETDSGQLIVCVVGSGPPANARYVGAGQTTIPPRNC